MAKKYHFAKSCFLKKREQQALESKAQAQGCINPCALCAADPRDCEWKAWAVIEEA